MYTSYLHVFRVIGIRQGGVNARRLHGWLGSRRDQVSQRYFRLVRGVRLFPRYQADQWHRMTKTRKPWLIIWWFAYNVVERVMRREILF